MQGIRGPSRYCLVLVRMAVLGSSDLVLSVLLQRSTEIESLR
jgi:hypothetical protein